MKEPDKSIRSFFMDFFQWLDHNTLELRVIDTVNGRVVFQDYNVTDAEFFAEKCLQYNGTFQVYYSAQPRDGKGGSYDNVPALTFIPIDVDAIRPNKKTEPANASQRFNAKRNTAKILKYLKTYDIKPSLVVDTGNGYLILIRIPSLDTAPHFYKTGESTQNVLSNMVNHWLQHEVKSLCDGTVEIDSVGDLPRILGVPGTVNMKSPKDKPRVRTIILGDITKPPNPQPAMWKLVEEAWQRKDVTPTLARVTVTQADDLLRILPERLRDGYKRPEPGKRSDVLLQTLLYLANHGWTREECVAAMVMFTEKIGRSRWPAAQQYDKLVAEGKIQPSTFNLGKYTLRVKGDTAIVYEGNEPIYPLKLRELNSHSARKALAKSLELDRKDVDRVAATILHFQLRAQKDVKEATPKAEAGKPSEATAEAEEILKTKDPIEYAADVVQFIHYGDRAKSKVVWLGVISPELGYGLNEITVGTTGVGKSDLVYAVLCCVPDQYVVKLKECSPKAIYYAVKAGVDLGKAVIYFDDVPDKPEVVKLLKDMTSENRANPRLWSVTVEREFLDVELKGDFVVFASAISNLTDKGGQIVRRYLVLNPDENPETNRKVLEKIKTDMRLGRGRRWLPPEFEVAKEVTRLIKEADYEVHIPFDFDYPDYGTLARSELKQFTAIIRAVTKARFKRRLTIGRILLAQPEDFETALKLWGERQPGKVDELAVKVLEELGEEEPQEMLGDEGKRTSVFLPQPVTSTIIAKRLRGKPRAIRDKLKHLYNMGYVDRKSVGGRGNPYAYWKSPAYLGASKMPKSLSPSLKKDLISGVNDYYAQTKTQYKEFLDAEKTWLTYVERVKKYSDTVIRHSRNNRLTTKPVSFKEKEQDNLGDSEKPKPLGVFPLSTKPQLKPEAALETEVLPKGLRIPPSLEDHITIEKQGKEWHVQCLLCARQGKQFYTANVGDMIPHIQRVHEKLRFPPSVAKEETKNKPPLEKDETPRSSGEKLEIVYGKCRELAVDSLVSKFAVADASKGILDRSEVFKLLVKLESEGKLVAKGPEWYMVV